MSDHARVYQHGVEVHIDPSATDETARVHQHGIETLFDPTATDETGRVYQHGIEILVDNPLFFRKVIMSGAMRIEVQGEAFIASRGMSGSGSFVAGSGSLGVSF